MKDQVHLNMRYFIHCLKTNLTTESWFDIITEYYDYLEFNLGNPGVGLHIFEECVKQAIKHTKFDDVEFSDEQRQLLLSHIQPSSETVEQRQKSNGQLDELYPAFQNWLEVLPDIGGIKDLKRRLTGKFPMSLFLCDIKYNRYSGIATSSVKTLPKLIQELEHFTKTILESVQKEIKEGDDDSSALALVEEKLRINHLNIFNSTNITNGISELVIRWLSAWIEYFKEIRSLASYEYQKKIDTYLSKQIENQITLEAKLDIVVLKLNGLDKQIESTFNERVKSILDRIDDIEERYLIEAQSKIEQLLVSPKVSSTQKDNLSIKHKIKTSIPVFLFTRFESELELGITDKIPTNWREFKALLFKNKE